MVIIASSYFWIAEERRDHCSRRDNDSIGRKTLIPSGPSLFPYSIGRTGGQSFDVLWVHRAGTDFGALLDTPTNWRWISVKQSPRFWHFRSVSQPSSSSTSRFWDSSFSIWEFRNSKLGDEQSQQSAFSWAWCNDAYALLHTEVGFQYWENKQVHLVQGVDMLHAPAENLL